MNEIEKKLSQLNGTLDDLYEKEVNDRIRKRYSLSREMAILRQRDTKPEEFAEYNAYAEQCKAEAKAEVFG
jgi:hypothetical protein